MGCKSMLVVKVLSTGHLLQYTMHTISDNTQGVLTMQEPGSVPCATIEDSVAGYMDGCLAFAALAQLVQEPGYSHMHQS